MQSPSLLRRLGGLLYDGLTFIALWMLAAAIFTSVYGSVSVGVPRLVLQTFCFVTIAGYFVWCWSNGGQTLGMRAWRLKVVYADGEPLTFFGAVLRFVLATAGLLAAGFSIWWVFVDRDGRFLHDRLAKTRVDSV